MKRFLFTVLAEIMFLLIGCGDGRAQSPPLWAEWEVERDDRYDEATYSPDLSDETAPRVRTVPIEKSGHSGDPHEDLQSALAVLWLDMNEVEAVDVSQEDRLVVWGDAETEHGERRFAAALTPSEDGPVVTAFVATAEDFEAMGGPGFLGGNAAKGQPLASAQASGAAVLQPGAFEAGAGQPEDAPAVTEASAPPAGALADAPSVPLPIAAKREDGTGYIPGRPKDAGRGYTPRPGDATAPRLQYWTFEVGEVSSPAEAATQAIKEIGLKKATHTAPHQIPSHVQIAGDEGYVVIGAGEAGGQKHDFALLIKKDGEDGHFHTSLLHAPPATYESWDGVLGSLDTFGLMHSDVRDAFDAKLRRQIREASPEEQSKIFVQVAELSIKVLTQQMIAAMMMQHQSTMDMMQQMNSNIATETSCILTSGCQIEYDGSGNAQMGQGQ